MALKPDRIETQTDISFFMNNTGTRGGVVSVVTGGSGVAMDDGSAVVNYVSNPSGAKPIGILLNDVVNNDLTRQHINYHQDEVQTGSKVAILRVGQVTTNSITTGTANPSAGADAYLGTNGNLAAFQAAGAVKVGQWLSAQDSESYAKVSINIT
tara:strand:- start:619 stop:1080 length:462 start_codon:yes stop_codon:yes gene_type:complete